MIVLPYQRQPVGSIRPNRQNTWLDRATGLWVFSQPYNLITGEPTVLSGSAYFTAAQQGIAARTVATTGRIQLASDSRNIVPTSGGFTVALHYRKIGAAAASAGFGLDATASAAFRAGTHFPFSDGTLYWDFGGNSAGTSRLTAASLTYGDDFWVFTAGVRGMEIWQNGIRRAQQASAVDWSSNSNPYLLGMHGTATNADDSECAIFLTCARQWSAAECAAWNRETAWDTVEPVVLYVKPAAAGSYTLTADAGSFTLSGQDATLSKSRILTADAGAFTLTGQDATLARNRFLTADAGSFTLTGQDATLTYAAAGSYTLVADAGSFTLSGQDATLLKTRILTADAGSFTLSGQSATLTWSGEPIVSTPREPQPGYDWGAWVRKLGGPETPYDAYQFTNRKFKDKGNPYE